jgi:zinc transport system ATP-binding protein
MSAFAPGAEVLALRRDESRAPLLEGRGLRLTFDDRPVLADVDVTVAPGEIVTVIGPNGAGKTTLLRVLLGLIRPDLGTVEKRPGLRVGYLPQRMSVDPVMPLAVDRLMTLTRRAARTDIRAALAETGVAHLERASVATLSGGELQRVLLARALLVQPDLLVLDEPVQGVDFAGEAALYELIGGLRARRGCGVLMISHDLHVVMAATDRVICLNRHVCCAGSPDAVSRHPEYMRLFGRHAASALAVYTHRHDHGHDLDGDVVALPESQPPPVAATARSSGRERGR